MRVNSDFDLCAVREREREKSTGARAYPPRVAFNFICMAKKEANNKKFFQKERSSRRLSLSLRMSHSNISSLDTKEKQKKKKTKRRDHVATRGEKEKEK